MGGKKVVRGVERGRCRRGEGVRWGLWGGRLGGDGCLGVRVCGGGGHNWDLCALAAVSWLAVMVMALELWRRRWLDSNFLEDGHSQLVLKG